MSKQELNHESINERLNLLFQVLFYDSEYLLKLTRGERICINQERGALFDAKNNLDGELALEEVRTYRVTTEIETKIEFIKSKL